MANTLRRSLFLWLPLLLYMAIMSASSFLPRIAWQSGISDKFMHLVEFALLCVLFIRALGGGLFRPASFNVFLVSAVLSFVYGLINEIQQAFVPFRYFELLDVASNAGGIVIGIGCALALQRVFPRSASVEPSSTPPAPAPEES